MISRRALLAVIGLAPAAPMVTPLAPALVAGAEAPERRRYGPLLEYRDGTMFIDRTTIEPGFAVDAWLDRLRERHQAFTGRCRGGIEADAARLADHLCRGPEEQP